MRKNIDHAKRRASYQFDSLAELSRFISDTPRKWRSKSSESEGRSKSWDLGAGFADAVRMARDGWLEGAKLSEAALAVFAPKDAAPDTVTDFYGHMPHVPRFCAGAPDSMIRKARDGRGGMGRVLTLYIPVNALAGVSAASMANFGVAVAQYINELETAKNVRCEVFGTMTSNVSGYILNHTWLVKRADQPLDLAVMAFAIGHPAMFRRLGFALRERSDVREDPSYGTSIDTKLSYLLDPPSGAYVLNGMKDADTVARTPEKALAFIEKQISKALEVSDADSEGDI